MNKDRDLDMIFWVTQHGVICIINELGNGKV